LAVLESAVTLVCVFIVGTVQPRPKLRNINSVKEIKQFTKSAKTVTIRHPSEIALLFRDNAAAAAAAAICCVHC